MSEQDSNQKITVSFNGCPLTIEGITEISSADIRKRAIMDESIAHIEEEWPVSVKEEDGRFRELEEEEIVVLVEAQEFSCTSDDISS